MDQERFRDRVLAFAAGAGATVLILSLLALGATLEGIEHGRSAVLPLSAALLAVISATITAVATFQALAPVAQALDEIIDQVAAVAAGELRLSFSRLTRQHLPRLADSLDIMTSKVRSSIDNIQQLALHDPVTDLPNRLNFRRQVERIVRHTPGPHLLFFFDLDRFKAVNDSLGHAQGDILLATFAARMKVLIDADPALSGAQGHKPAILARLSGDEFVLFVPGGDRTKIQGIARRIFRTLEEPFELAGSSVTLNASIGACVTPDDGQDYDTLMRHADTAMYAAKEQGRAQIQCYSETMSRRAMERLQIDGQLRDAIAAQQFELFFQPQVDATTGEVAAAEALIRWRHPVDGLRAPGGFIAAAEESGQIIAIGQWVLTEACRTLAEWPAGHCPARLSINVSPRQLDSDEFVSAVHAALSASGLAPSRLELEITESVVMQHDKSVIDRLTELRALGISIAIDDFGTGYSNLARLKKLPIDRLKIDRSLIQDVAFSADARTIISAIVSLAHGLGYECVAEGVETPLQADILAVMGCDLLQGFAYSEPVDRRSFAGWLASYGARSRVRTTALTLS